MSDISVVICSVNPQEDCFRRVLDALQAQTLSKDKWELLLVGLAETKTFDLSWHPNVRYLREEKKGLASAHLTGVLESESDLLVFVDDDNVLRTDYLENALKISASSPKLGACSGNCIPEFESEPPTEMRLYYSAPSLIETAKIPMGAEALPGSGIVMRKKLALYYIEQVFGNATMNIVDPHNKQPLCKNDFSLTVCAFQMGLAVCVLPQLKLTHLIAAKDLNFKFRKPSWLRSFLLGISMFGFGKNRTERRIKLAEEHGRIRALRDLKQIGRRKAE